jgi:hypothetical protein
MTQVGADRAELAGLRQELAGIHEQQRSHATAWAENQKARSGARREEISQLNQDRARLESEATRRRQKASDIRKRMDALERRASLRVGDKPWLLLPLVDPTGTLIEEHIGIFGEANLSRTLQAKGFEPLGATVDRRAVKSPEGLAKALEARAGKRDIDGLYKRNPEGRRVTEYLVAESKATAERNPRRPTGAGALKKLRTGERQLSRDWVKERLVNAGLEPRDLANIQAGLEHAGKEVEVIHPDGTKETVIVRKVYAQTFPVGNGEALTRIYDVRDTTDGVNVVIEDQYWP